MLEYDPELKAGLAVVGGVLPPTITPDLIPFVRRSFASPPVEELLAGRPVLHEEREIPGHRGEPILVSVFRSIAASGPRPAVLYLHSGGLMFGDRHGSLVQTLDWVERLGIVLVSPEYRLAPEHPDPYAREDSWATLSWMVAHHRALGIDLTRIVTAGASAGGAIAAGLALAARDRGGPPLRGQLLSYPMLDDRGTAPSITQFDGQGVWDRVSNETGWRAALGAAYRTAHVSPYIAPARADDLSGLPPAFLECGSVEIFRDEVVDFASRLWQAGSDAELHVWAGGFHGFDIFAPHTSLGKGVLRDRLAWLERRLGD